MRRTVVTEILLFLSLAMLAGLPGCGYPPPNAVALRHPARLAMDGPGVIHAGLAVEMSNIDDGLVGLGPDLGWRLRLSDRFELNADGHLALLADDDGGDLLAGMFRLGSTMRIIDRRLGAVAFAFGMAGGATEGYDGEEIEPVIGFDSAIVGSLRAASFLDVYLGFRFGPTMSILGGNAGVAAVFWFQPSLGLRFHVEEFFSFYFEGAMAGSVYLDEGGGSDLWGGLVMGFAFDMGGRDTYRSR